VVEARDVGPDFEGIRAGVAVVEPVGAARLGRDDDRPGPALAELRLVMGPEVLVVVGRERVQEERHPIAARRSRLRGHVEGVRWRTPWY